MEVPIGSEGKQQHPTSVVAVEAALAAAVFRFEA